MEELWRQATEMMSERPVLWLPVLVADLLGFLLNLGATAMVRAAILSRLQYQSALGGGPMRAPMNANALQHATTLALAITWSSNFVRLLLYAAAFITTAALVRAFRNRIDKPAGEILPALKRNAAGIVSLALRSFALYAFAAFSFSWLGRSLIAHGHKAVLASGWLEIGASIILIAVLALLLAPVAIQTFARHRPTPDVQRNGQLFALGLAAVALVLGRFVESNLRSVHIAFQPARYALGLTGSLIVALPYAVLFAGLGLLAWKTAREAPTPAEQAVEVG
ncbi:MAG: hypothetical protein ACRYFU_26845 [Janthinobacterium lividum]